MDSHSAVPSVRWIFKERGPPGSFELGWRGRSTREGGMEYWSGEGTENMMFFMVGDGGN